MKVISIDTLPGSAPYENYRVMRVKSQHAGLKLIDFLCQFHPPTKRSQWLVWINAGDILIDKRLVSPDDPVSAGERYIHKMQNVTEPDVANRIRITYEDDSLLVIDKPAPLPVHPSGRFNRNTLTELLKPFYPNQTLRIAHRIDANTTGIVVFCRTRQAASIVQPQFEKRTVIKEYIAKIDGKVDWQTHECNLPIGLATESFGANNTRGARVVDCNGLNAMTHFEVIQRHKDRTTLVRAVPLTGRTNQIRVHLWALGHPVIGDPLYLPSKRLGTQQTLGINQPPMCLHAAKITLNHPANNQRICFESSPPENAFLIES